MFMSTALHCWSLASTAFRSDLNHAESSFHGLKMLEGFYQCFREMCVSAVELCVLIISSVLNQEMDCSVHVSFSFIEFQIGDQPVFKGLFS